MPGYVFEWRDAMENPADNEDILDRPAGRYQAWRYLIQRARWQAGEMKWTTKRGDVIPVPRGSFVTTLRRFADDLGWSHDRVRRIFEAWVRRGRIACESRHGFILVTLCNYEHYNPAADEVAPGGAPDSRHGRATVAPPSKKLNKGEEPILEPPPTRAREVNPHPGAEAEPPTRRSFGMADDLLGLFVERWSETHRAEPSWTSADMDAAAPRFRKAGAKLGKSRVIAAMGEFFADEFAGVAAHRPGVFMDRLDAYDLRAERAAGRAPGRVVPPVQPTEPDEYDRAIERRAIRGVS